MSLEEQIQAYYFNIFDAKNIWYVHIPKSFYMKKRKSKLTYFPDCLACYNNKYYIREFGAKNCHTDRKSKQMIYMQRIKENAPDVTDIKIILSLDAAEQDLKEIGIIH